ncbi:hypothetical protein ACLB2K_016218 [Fragaria x ananassa]
MVSLNNSCVTWLMRGNDVDFAVTFDLVKEDYHAFPVPIEVDIQRGLMVLSAGPKDSTSSRLATPSRLGTKQVETIGARRRGYDYDPFTAYDPETNAVEIRLNMDLLEESRDKAYLRTINKKQKIAQYYNKKVVPRPLKFRKHELPPPVLPNPIYRHFPRPHKPLRTGKSHVALVCRKKKKKRGRYDISSTRPVNSVRVSPTSADLLAQQQPAAPRESRQLARIATRESRQLARTDSPISGPPRRESLANQHELTRPATARHPRVSPTSAD